MQQTKRISRRLCLVRLVALVDLLLLLANSLSIPGWERVETLRKSFLEPALVM